MASPDPALIKRMPKISDFTPSTVKRGAGYVVGQLADDSPMMPYLKKTALVGYYDSLGAFFHCIDDLKWKPEQEEASNRSRHGSEAGFYTFNSLKEARDVYQNNPKSIRNFTEETITLRAEESVGKEVRHDVTGDFIDIGKFLEGQPECFGVSYNGNPSGLYTTIYMNASAVCYVTAEAVNHKQARLLRLVDWMETQGIRCRIIAVLSTSCAHMEVVVKDFSDPVNMNQVAVVGHSDFLRRLGFLFDEQSPTWGYGYGNPTVYTSAMQKNYRAKPEDGLTIFIGDSSHSELPKIDKQFDKLRGKIEVVLDAPPEQRDFDKVYSVEL